MSYSVCPQPITVPNLSVTSDISSSFESHKHTGWTKLLKVASVLSLIIAMSLLKSVTL